MEQRLTHLDGAALGQRRSQRNDSGEGGTDCLFATCGRHHFTGDFNHFGKGAGAHGFSLNASLSELGGGKKNLIVGVSFFFWGMVMAAMLVMRRGMARPQERSGHQNRRPKERKFHGKGN